MKVLNFCLIEKKASLVSQDIESGRWYHSQRTVYVETKTHAAFVTMGIFERAIATILKTCSLGCFDYKAFLLDKTMVLLDSRVENVIGSSSSSSSNSKIEQPAYVPLSAERLRATYPSFSAYQQERESLGEPVDLIIGRGIKISKETPNLNDQRKIGKDIMKPYRPFTVDRDPNELPDLVQSISARELPDFLDNSIDDIYLERIHPYSTWCDVKLYCNACRMLKKDGTLVIDFNDGMRTKEHRNEQIYALNLEFCSLGIMLIARLADDSCSRNDLDVEKFVCVKYDDRMPPALSPRYLSERNEALEKKLIALHQRYAPRDPKGNILNSFIKW